MNTHSDRCLRCSRCLPACLPAGCPAGLRLVLNPGLAGSMDDNYEAYKLSQARSNPESPARQPPGELVDTQTPSVVRQILLTQSIPTHSPHNMPWRAHYNSPAFLTPPACTILLFPPLQPTTARLPARLPTARPTRPAAAPRPPARPGPNGSTTTVRRQAEQSRSTTSSSIRGCTDQAQWRSSLSTPH